MGMNYNGVMIEESLSDESVLSDPNIISTEIEEVTEKHATPWLDRWALDTIEIPESEIDDIAERVSKSFDLNGLDEQAVEKNI